MGDTNPELSHQAKPNRPTKLEWVTFIIQLILAGISLGASVYAFSVIYTNPSRYQDTLRRLYESAQSNDMMSRALRAIPPNLTPLVTWANSFSFILFSNIISAYIACLVLFCVAGIVFASLVKKGLTRGPHAPVVSNENGASEN